MSEESIETTKTIDPSFDWARTYARERAWLMSNGVVSRAIFFHERGTYISPVNKEAVDAPVLELEDGNAFLAEEETNFVKLTTEEVRFHNQVTEATSVLIGSCARLGAQLGVKEDRGITVIVAVLQQVIRRLAS